jgi:peptide/nickel transport system permease protein
MQNGARFERSIPTANLPQLRKGAFLKQFLQTNLGVFRRDPLALIGLVLMVFFVGLAILAPALAPYDPLQNVEGEGGIWLSNEKPSADFRLGTTNLGRDIFSQLLYGARPAIIVGFSAAVAVSLIGTIVGLLAGYFGGWVDTILMRLADIAFGIPFLPFIIVLSAFRDPSLWNVVLALSALLWRDSSRVIRSHVLVIREQAFVSAAKVSGASHFRIVFIYIAPSICRSRSCMARWPSAGPSWPRPASAFWASVIRTWSVGALCFKTPFYLKPYHAAHSTGSFHRACALCSL